MSNERLNVMTLRELAKTPKSVLRYYDTLIDDMLKELQRGLDVAKQYEGKSDYTCYDELRYSVKKVIEIHDKRIEGDDEL